jgi:ubiquinone/menaquinone biosynthesis C-methylase UbiE
MSDARFVGSIPENYDTGLGPVIFADVAVHVAAMVAAGNPHDVLETAAGTGIVSKQLRARLPPGSRLVVTDLNQPMLEVAKTKFAAGDRVEFGPADAQALPFADASFDRVVCQFGIMFYPDKPQSFREALRVLRPGGRYVFSIWDSHQHNPFGRISHETVARFFPDNPPQFQRVPFSYTLEEGKNALVEAGFDDIVMSVWRLQKPVPDLSLLARGVVHGSPLIEQIRTRGGVDPADVQSALEAEFAAAFPMGTMPLQALIFSARRPA